MSRRKHNSKKVTQKTTLQMKSEDRNQEWTMQDMIALNKQRQMNSSSDTQVVLNKDTLSKKLKSHVARHPDDLVAKKAMVNVKDDTPLSKHRGTFRQRHALSLPRSSRRHLEGACKHRSLSTEGEDNELIERIFNFEDRLQWNRNNFHKILMGQSYPQHRGEQ